MLRKSLGILMILAVLLGFCGETFAKEKIVKTVKEFNITYEVIVDGNKALLRTELQPFIKLNGNSRYRGLTAAQVSIRNMLLQLAKNPVNKTGTSDNYTAFYSGSVRAPIENDGTYLFINLNTAVIDDSKISVNRIIGN